MFKVSDLMKATIFPKAGYIIEYSDKVREAVAEKPRRVKKYFTVDVEEAEVIAWRDENLQKDLSKLRDEGYIIKFVKKILYPGYVVED